MGVFSIDHEGAYNGTPPLHELNIGFNEDYTSGIDMAIALVEARENEFAVLQAGIKEDMVAAMCEDYMDRVYINEATASGLLGKIKEILTKLLEKLKSIFHAFMAKLNSFFMDADKFYKKYASEIARKNFSNFHIKARECHVDRLNSFITYTDDTVNTGLIKSITDAKGSKINVDWTSQSDVDKVMDKDFIGEKVISNIFSSDCLKNTSIEADFSDINKELEDYIFEDAETHDEWSGTSIVTSPWVGGLLSQKKFISDIKKANDKCEKKLENMIRKIEKDSANITKAIGNKGEYSSNKYEYKHESYNWNVLNEAEDAEGQLREFREEYIKKCKQCIHSAEANINGAKSKMDSKEIRQAFSFLRQTFTATISGLLWIPKTAKGSNRNADKYDKIDNIANKCLDYIHHNDEKFHVVWYDEDGDVDDEDDLNLTFYWNYIESEKIKKLDKESRTADESTAKKNFKEVLQLVTDFKDAFKRIALDGVVNNVIDKYDTGKGSSRSDSKKKEEKPKRVVKLGDNSKKYNDPKKIKYEEQKKAEQLRQEREEQERKAADAKAEAERKAEEARKAKEAAERKKKEEEARKAREEAEKEAQRKKELAEKEAKAREEAIKKAEEDKKKAEAEAKKKEEEAKKAAEEAKRLKDEEDKKKAEAEAKKKEEEAKKAAEEAKKAEEIAKEEARKKKEADEAAKKKVVSVPPSGSSGSGTGSPSSGDSSKDSTPPPEPPKSSETDKERKQEEKKKKTEAKKPASAPEEHKGFGIEATPVYNVSGDKELTTLLKSVAWLQQYFSKYQECMSKSQSVRLSSAKKAMSQAKKIFAAAVAYNPKNENYEYYTAIGESAEFEAMMSME